MTDELFNHNNYCSINEYMERVTEVAGEMKSKET